jgi:hypothetical protein
MSVAIREYKYMPNKKKETNSVKKGTSMILCFARSQALPGNVFLAALPPVQFVGGRASENVPRQSLGTSDPRFW